MDGILIVIFLILLFAFASYTLFPPHTPVEDKERKEIIGRRLIIALSVACIIYILLSKP